ncbi:hypothetical protein ACNHKD_09050 [Methylocystis sp. JAN1]|uniref:hypothetical protein n=1 Tax=Methylocystis sp. JAN1 TaxID=3397211 RepID=UPI003FA1C7F7
MLKRIIGHYVCHARLHFMIMLETFGTRIEYDYSAIVFFDRSIVTRHLLYFRDVASEGGATRASEKLRCARPIMSGQIVSAAIASVLENASSFRFFASRLQKSRAG